MSVVTDSSKRKCHDWNFYTFGKNSLDGGKPKNLLLGLLFWVSGNQAFAQTFSKQQNELIDKQKSYFDAVIKKNYEYLDGLLAEDYIGGYSLGIIDKAKESKDLREFPLKEYQMSETKVVLPNPKTGIIVFKLHVTVTVEGKDYSEDDILNCVWTKYGKKWLLSSQSAVKVVKNT